MLWPSHLQPGHRWRTCTLHYGGSMAPLRGQATPSSSVAITAAPLPLRDTASVCSASSNSSGSSLVGLEAATAGSIYSSSSISSSSVSEGIAAVGGSSQRSADSGSAAQPAEQAATPDRPDTHTAGSNMAKKGDALQGHDTTAALDTATAAATSSSSDSSNDSSRSGGGSATQSAGMGGGRLAKASIQARLQQARSLTTTKEGPRTSGRPTRSISLRACALQDAVQPLAPELQALLPGPGCAVTAADALAFAEAAAAHYRLPSPLATLVVTAVMQRRLRSFVPLCGYMEAMLRLAQAYGTRPVAAWVRRAPGIVRQEDQVAPRLALLGALSGLAPAAVVALTQRCPPLLAVEERLMTPRLQALCAALGRPQEQGPDLLRAAPAALALRPAMLRYKASLLAAAAASHPRWAVWWATASPTSVAVAVTYSRQRLLRLDYVRALGAQGSGACIQVAVQDTDAAFSALHPRYPAWASLWGAPLLQLEEALGLAPSRVGAAAAAAAHADASSSSAAAAEVATIEHPPEELTRYRRRAAAAACAAQWLDKGVWVPGPGDTNAWEALVAAAGHIQEHLGELHVACGGRGHWQAKAAEVVPGHSLYSSQQWEHICRVLEAQQQQPFPAAVRSDALTAAPAAAFTAEYTSVLYLVAALAAAAMQRQQQQQQQQQQYGGQVPQGAAAAGASAQSLRVLMHMAQQRLQQAGTLTR